MYKEKKFFRLEDFLYCNFYCSCNKTGCHVIQLRLYWFFLRVNYIQIMFVNSKSNKFCSFRINSKNYGAIRMLNL